MIQSVQASRANINTLNFAICFILPYSISIFKLNDNVWALSVATRTDKLLEYIMHHMAHQTNHECWFAFAMSSFLDQYLGGEELEELILEEGNVFDNDLS